MVDVAEPDELSTVTGPGSEPEQPRALQAYRARTTRANRIYSAVLVGIVVLAFGAVKLAYAHGELTKVSFGTAAAPAPVPEQNTSRNLTQAWHSTDRPALGEPFADGIVVTSDAHSVHGRDAVTGAIRWYYTRSDQTICSVLQQDSTTIAIYRRGDNCDEVTGFVTATGVAKWFRTLTENGSYATASTSNVVLAVTDHSVHEFDNAGGLDRWNWATPDGCTAVRALAGSLGALISLDCGATHRLVLRDLFSDSEKWTVATPAAMVPVAASSFVGALDPATGALHSYTAAKGVDSTTGRLPGAGPAARELPRAATSVTVVNAAGQSVEVSWIGKLFAFSAKGSVNWSAAASSQPWPVANSLIAVADGPATVVQYRLDTGARQLISTLTPSAAVDQRPYPVGAGLLMAGNQVSMFR